MSATRKAANTVIRMQCSSFQINAKFNFQLEALDMLGLGIPF